MRLTILTTACAILGASHAAQATIGCQVVALDAKDASARLYQRPDDGSEVLRRVTLGDIVFYPDDSLAPDRVQGWAWVRHDISQEDIWQSGIYGWMRVETIDTCG